MRFLFCDRVVELEPGRRALGRKVISIDALYFTDHFSRRAVMPAPLLIEAVAQLSGWLNFVTHERAIRMVVALVEEVEILADVAPGDVLDVEVWVDRLHAGGLTVRGEVRNGSQPVATIGRMVFANQAVAAGGFSPSERRHHVYLDGGAAEGQERA